MFISARFAQAALAALVLLACARPGAARDGRTPAQEFFRFQSNFWMNLHHTLFREGALRRAGGAQGAAGAPAPLSEAGLSEGERRIWADAVGFYARRFAGARLLFDEQLVRINNALSGQQDPAGLRAPALAQEVALTLERAAPVYRKHWWPAHDKANRAWIASVGPAVEKTAPEVITQLEGLFRHRWAAPLTVDVTYFVAEVGHAYTTERPAYAPGRPGHTTIASAEPTHQGPDGIELVFHEGAHTLTGEVESALAAECGARGKSCGDLWHALQFFTVGEVVKRRLKKDGLIGFTPYAYKYRLYERGEWPRFRPALEADWLPYVEGRTTFAGAIKQLVKDI